MKETILAIISIPCIFSIFFLASRTFACYFLRRKPNHKPIETNTVKNQIAQKIDALIQKSAGRFFTLKFEKLDGTIRVINSKNKYNRLIKGTGSPATDALKEKGFKSAVNRNSETWFSFLPEKAKEFKCGEIHEFF